MNGESGMTERPDKSNGYESIADVYIAGRGSGKAIAIGESVVREWAETELAPAATVLDLGCGPGYPITRIFVERGFKVYALDASPTMVRTFTRRFPNVPVQCIAAEESSFFNRTFDAVVSWGLFFLLEDEVQRRLFAKIAGALRSGGKFLFTATRESCTWNDAMTGRRSVSMGEDGYRRVLEDAGLTLIATRTDEGGNCHYFVKKY